MIGRLRELQHNCCNLRARSIDQGSPLYKVLVKIGNLDPAGVWYSKEFSLLQKVRLFLHLQEGTAVNVEREGEEEGNGNE